MVSCRGQKGTAVHRNLQLLGSIINSHQQKGKASVILDASLYKQLLGQTLEELNQAVAAAQNLIHYDPVPMLTIEAQEKGFMMKVLSQRSCQGLLVFILEAIEELGLDVLQARVSCVDSFCLEAVIGTKKDNEETGHMDAKLVEQAVSQAIRSWKELTN